MIYGYALVFTTGQSAAAQVAALTEAGAEKSVQGNGERRVDRAGAAATSHCCA